MMRTHSEREKVGPTIAAEKERGRNRGALVYRYVSLTSLRSRIVPLTIAAV